MGHQSHFQLSQIIIFFTLSRVNSQIYPPSLLRSEIPMSLQNTPFGDVLLPELLRKVLYVLKEFVNSFNFFGRIENLYSKLQRCSNHGDKL
ncbi:hypothetical protein CEXT_271091 [Caerostris extrusa]|uniref:Maturase K n=1 Tax=Caerostris extrusa TaxID=172846 RepID=A0AAV4YBG0_CAEEX|nr:hypothetical protein CEXT_271091 [Caerostris extrusa]